MRYDLIDYQRAAAVDCLKRLRQARHAWDEFGDRSAFALSAITGAGKTVIATAVIEAMLHGSADLGMDADERATFLWVTDDPALNRQTRNKMLAASELLALTHLVEIDNGFMDSALSPGRVYFLNVQKLSKTSGLAHGGGNQRQYSMWDVLANTVNGDTADVYLILDEAHRGMKTATDRRTIVQRLVGGQPGSNPAVPVVWGISATIERFANAMRDVSDRTTLTPVVVDIERVQASGLVKDEIVLDEPDESGTFTETLLRQAVRTTLDYQARWAAYATAEDEPLVEPVLVVQAPDKASDAKLAETVEIIEAEWPGLGPNAIAHVFGEHDRLRLGARSIDWIQPELIHGDREVRVVLAKQAISTGWDCPRAEVLYSERPAQDATHIAQIVGRMVRQPLARRIATDDALNTVACFLPRFDRQALGRIKTELEGGGDAGRETRVAAAVVRGAQVFERNPAVPEAAFDAIALLPSLPTPDLLASPLRRAKELTRLLTDTAHGDALLPAAGAELTRVLVAKLDGLAAEHADAVAANVANLESADVRRTRLGFGGAELGTATHSLAVDRADLIRDTGRIIKGVKEGVGQDYWSHCHGRRDRDDDPLDVRVRVAALFLVDGVRAVLDDTATGWVRQQLHRFAVDIKNTTGARRDQFRRVQEHTTDPEVVAVDLRDNVTAPTRDGDGGELPTFPGHLYAGSNGRFPAALNDWERTIVETELARPSFVAWYRNPPRATPASLRIAYRHDVGDWASLQVDVLVVSRRDDGALGVSIIDPHGDHLADARAKLRALADYADQHGDAYVRIESVAEVGDDLRVLDLTDDRVRAAVRAFEGAKVSALYDSDLARPYR